MAVPRSERKTSSMEYVANAERLAAKAFRFSNGLPKRYAFRMANPLFQHAEEVVYHCRAANLVYVRDEATLAQRRSHLTEAEGHLLHVETLLGILHEVTSQLAATGDAKPPNDNVYSEFSGIITEQRRLLSGVKRHDTAAYNRRRQEAGAPPDNEAAPGYGPRRTGGFGPSTARPTSATSTPTARSTTTTRPTRGAWSPDSVPHDGIRDAVTPPGRRPLE